MPGVEVHNGVRYSYADARAAGFPEPSTVDDDDAKTKREAEPAHDKARRTARTKRVSDSGRDTTS